MPFSIIDALMVAPMIPHEGRFMARPHEMSVFGRNG